MAKAIKLNNDVYLDSNNVNYKRKILKDIISNILSNPIGEFVIWEGEKEIVENGTWHYLGQYYWLKESVNIKFPLKNGFKRLYKICLESSDNIISDEYKYLRFSQNSYSKEYLFPTVWGETETGIRTISILDFDYDNLPNGHITINATPSFETNGTIMRIYKLYLLIYDTIE